LFFTRVFLPVLFLSLLPAVSFGAGGTTFPAIKQWFILLDYDPSKVALAPRSVKSFDLAILDADSHPPLDIFRTQTVLLAYVSLGEAEDYRFYWDKIKDANFLAEKNPDWPGNYRVDVRDPSWQDLVLNEIIPRLKQDGFCGIFMDTLDTAAYLEEKAPEKYRGSKAAMIALVKAIHERYPEMFLVSNNGFDILENLVPFLSALVVEDIFMMPDFEKGGYIKVPEIDREFKLTVLKRIQQKYKLPVLNIEYVDSKDRRARRYCIRESRRLNFVPYAAQKDLAEIYAQ